MSFTFIQQDGTKLTLREPPSSDLRLMRAGGSEPANIRVAKWLPSDRRNSNVEIRISLLNFPRTTSEGLIYGLGTYRDPIITYALEVSTGSVTVKSPEMRIGGNAASSGFFAVPARGAVHRVCAREITVHVRFEGNHKAVSAAPNAIFPWVDVRVSFMPVDSAALPPPPFSALTLPGIWSGKPQAFPAEATEFRLVTQDGAPWADDAGQDIAFTTSIGGSLRDQSNHNLTWKRSDFADWHAISPRMFAWMVVDNNTYWQGGAPGAPWIDSPENASESVIALYR